MNSYKQEVNYTPRHEVICAGADDLTDHPTVFLKIDEKIKELACPYCNKLFKLTI